MIEAIKNFFLNSVGKHLCVLICSMIPIIECRGSIPMGAAFGLPIWQTYILSVVGNMIPVPFILLFIRKIIDLMSKSKHKVFYKFAAFLNRRVEKNRGKVEKFSFFGVTIFVAIPLPVTGAWTGSMIATMIGMKFWKALISTFLGVLISSAIMTVISYGIASIVS